MEVNFIYRVLVTLTGFVHSYWDKDAAEKAVKRVYGVRGVANDIEVKLSSARTDPEIAREAVHELDSHISIPSDKIKVTVKNGWVTLEGNVDWQYQKTLAESAVKKLIANRKAKALREKSSPGPATGKRNPPSAGPTIPPKFICTPLKMIAAGSSLFRTISGTIAAQTGPLKAKPTPSRKAAVRIKYGCTTWNQVKSARSPAAAANQR